MGGPWLPFEWLQPPTEAGSIGGCLTAPGKATPQTILSESHTGFRTDLPEPPQNSQDIFSSGESSRASALPLLWEHQALQPHPGDSPSHTHSRTGRPLLTSGLVPCGFQAIPSLHLGELTPWFQWNMWGYHSLLFLLLLSPSTLPSPSFPFPPFLPKEEQGSH